MYIYTLLYTYSHICVCTYIYVINILKTFSTFSLQVLQHFTAVFTETTENEVVGSTLYLN